MIEMYEVTEKVNIYLDKCHPLIACSAVNWAAICQTSVFPDIIPRILIEDIRYSHLL